MNILKLTSKAKINEWLDTINSIIDYIKNLSSFFVHKEDYEETIKNLENKIANLEAKHIDRENRILERIPKIPSQNISKEKVKDILSNIDKTKKDINHIQELIFTNIASAKNELEKNNEDKNNFIKEEISKINKTLSDKIDIINQNFLNKIYPIGSIYMSMDDTSPEILFGGVWSQIKDTFLLGAGSLYKCGEIGGEIEHTLSIEELPSHIHNTKVSEENEHKHGSGTLRGKYRLYKEDKNGKDFGAIEHKITGVGEHSLDGGVKITMGETSPSGKHTHNVEILSEGFNKPHNNMPPYLVVYIWKRIS